jgi:FixJ family two-component response regulator
MRVVEAPLICVIDDDRSMRESLMSLLRSAELRVEAFASSEAFLSHVPLERVACLILDVQLPGLSGLALQRTLTEMQVPIPVIFLTGHDDQRLAMQARHDGAVAWLTKPLQEQDLLHVIYQLKPWEQAYLRAV